MDHIDPLRTADTNLLPAADVDDVRKHHAVLVPMQRNHNDLMKKLDCFDHLQPVLTHDLQHKTGLDYGSLNEQDWSVDLLQELIDETMPDLIHEMLQDLTHEMMQENTP